MNLHLHMLHLYPVQVLYILVLIIYSGDTVKILLSTVYVAFELFFCKKDLIIIFE